MATTTGSEFTAERARVWFDDVPEADFEQTGRDLRKWRNLLNHLGYEAPDLATSQRERAFDLTWKHAPHGIVKSKAVAGAILAQQAWSGPG